MKIIIVSLILVSVFILPAMADNFAVNIEVGTYYDMLSLVTPYGDGDDARAIVASQVPSGTIDLGTGAASFYIMYFLSKHFTFGLETNMGTFSVFDDSSDGDGAIFSLGSLGGAAQTTYYLRDNSDNTPYLLGRISHTTLWGSDFSFYDDDFDITSLGTGIGYQYHIRPGFVLRTELRYHRMFAKPERDFSHVFSLIFGLGIK